MFLHDEFSQLAHKQLNIVKVKDQAIIFRILIGENIP